MTPSHHDHHDHKGHAHGPGGHVHAPANFGTAFAVGITLNTAFVMAEGIFGYVSNSMALVADAGHNLSDVLGLLVAWAAIILSKRAPSVRYTYGLRGSSILAALFNAVFLLVTVGAIGWEAIQRLLHPEPVVGVTVIAVAAAASCERYYRLSLRVGPQGRPEHSWGLHAHGSRRGRVNRRGNCWNGHLVHRLELADAATSLVISGVIIWGTWSLLRDSMAMSMSAVPPGIDPNAVRGYLEKCAGVVQVHDLHIWSMSTTEVALTCHMVISCWAP